TIGLAATGAATAFGAMCLSYAHFARDGHSRGAGWQAGRLFLAAAVMLAVALGSFYFESVTSGASERVRSVIFWLSVESRRLLSLAVLFAGAAVIRLYVHLLL